MWLFILIRVFINFACDILVRLTDIISITASTNKFINNLWTENISIRIFVCEWRNLSLVKTSLTFGILAKSFTTFFNFINIFSIFRIHPYDRRFKISFLKISYLTWHAFWICLINSSWEILIYDIIYHVKRVLVLK